MIAPSKIAPSILSADFARLGEQIQVAEKAGADQIHIDIMDGHFVPNLSMGPAVVEAVRRVTRLPLDIHLMVSEPQNFLQQFAAAGSNSLTVHAEIGERVIEVIDLIHALNLRAGIALKPGTSLNVLDHI